MIGLDVSGCTALAELKCYNNNLTELNVSSNTALQILWCDCSDLTELDISGCTILKQLYCRMNALTELDISSNTELVSLDCTENPLVYILLPYSPLFPMQVLRAEGRGYVSFYYNRYTDGDYEHYEFTTYAYPGTGAEFLGWYDDAGTLVSEAEEFTVTGSYTELVARFEGGMLPGDADGSGEVDIGDALLMLRAGMGLIEATPEQADACDTDGDGQITIADALLIMRSAMGLITLD